MGVVVITAKSDQVTVRKYSVRETVTNRDTE